MTHARQTDPEATRNPWTILRIQNSLAGETLIRRFLLDLTQAPEHRVMEVFTAWRKVAAASEAQTPHHHDNRKTNQWPTTADAPRRRKGTQK